MRVFNRRQFLTSSALATGACMLPYTNITAGEALAKRILVVIELSGGNDGLNSIVPYTNDAYYQLRPNIAIPPNRLLKMDDSWGFNPGMLGFERLWHSGDLAIVHGAGYDNPSFSHFTSMAYWHTAAPNSGNEFGWMGRLADSMFPVPQPNLLLNISSTQSLAVKSKLHTPVVFDDPDRFQRSAFKQQQSLLNRKNLATGDSDGSNTNREFLAKVAQSALSSSVQIQTAWSRYKTPVDYGLAPLGLPKVAACIDAGLPTQLYHVSFRNNAFDTHVQQPALHQRLLSYACDGIYGFIRDMERLGHGDRVAVMVYSEFGRRVPENFNLGTDHGSANNMFFVGKPVKGGHYGTPPSLTDLTEGDNFKHTLDFRQVYATAIERWLRHSNSNQILGGQFEQLPVFEKNSV